jgi:hypothetical protein
VQHGLLQGQRRVVAVVVVAVMVVVLEQLPVCLPVSTAAMQCREVRQQLSLCPAAGQHTTNLRAAA